MKKQQGIVLFLSLIILIIMTVIGVSLAVNSTQSLRMSGAGSERLEAKAIANGGLSQIISNYAGAAFANLDSEVNETTFNSTQVITPLPEGGVRDVGCQRTTNATGANLVSCRRAQVTSTAVFGRDNLGSLTVASGIEQQVLTGN
ncbi:PilX N-terminal domain-containing pilus assembly protein [Shewanella insulae]|uniref:Pilus assembly protein PilX n=1 Tax=Shewanella insulae TaxID=2681496 RepID=A0A6L7HV96_9GAMM|nr:PilX N-terminal domain-containing pilus assembly protein [Shewanella insulae]MCG9739460.1 PilX N-terminal domain-containing pilus assembly protein [Shewanella insulae]MXR68093.1 pilus assembly protein PilX [Shewanella insulae]